MTPEQIVAIRYEYDRWEREGQIVAIRYEYDRWEREGRDDSQHRGRRTGLPQQPDADP
jgi:hypothetical protein